MIQNVMCPKPKTTRRYIHPPMAERLFTLWAEGKIMFGDVLVDIEASRIQPEKYFNHYVGCGIWPVYGENLEQFDFRTVTNGITEDGTPIHSVSYQVGDLKVTLEVFCNTQRKATLFGKLTAENTGDAPLRETVSLLVRTGREYDLVFGRCDCYKSYDPDVQVWKDASSTWREEDGSFTDGERILTVSGNIRWDEENGAVALPIQLAAKEQTEYLFTLDKGEVTCFSYEEEKAACTAFWQKELRRINKLPRTLSEDPAQVKMIRHMVTQLLQMMSVDEATGMVLPRQGGLRRIIWPTEALSVVEGLCLVGDFDDYIEPVLSTYFDKLQLPTGEVGALGIYWASITGAALYSFAVYCRHSKNPGLFPAYREKVLKAYRFIRDLRRSVEDTETLGGGLFPVLQGIDWEQKFQTWTSTDVFNLLGLDALAKEFARQNDPAAEEIRQEHTAYLGDMKRHFKKYYDACQGSDALRIPLMPVGDDKKLVDDLYPLAYHGRFVYCGVVEGEEDTRRVYNFMVQNDITREGLGLYGHMRYEDGNPNIWYLSFPDYYWFEIWMDLGNREKAQEILEAQLYYAMSEEYAFCERVDTKDVYWAPWQPNASATGRTLIMLSKFYA